MNDEHTNPNSTPEPTPPEQADTSASQPDTASAEPTSSPQPDNPTPETPDDNQPATDDQQPGSTVESAPATTPEEQEPATKAIDPVPDAAIEPATQPAPESDSSTTDDTAPAQSEEPPAAVAAAAPQTQPAASTGKPHSRRKRTLLIVLLLVLILLVGALTVFALKYTAPVKEPAKHTETTTPAPKTADAKSIVDGAQQAIADKYQADNADLKLTRSDKGVSPAYQVSGTSFYVSGIASPELSVATTSDPTASNDTLGGQIISSLADYLTSKDLKQTNADQKTFFGEYQDDTVICTIPSADQASSNPILLTCADKSAYKQLSDKLQPFAAAVAASDSKLADGLVLSVPYTAQDSSVKGYQNAQVNMSNYGAATGGFMGLFYRQDGGEWHYFMGTQNILGCDDYKPANVQNAFAGTSCYDSATNKESTVQPASESSTSSSSQTTTQSSTHVDATVPSTSANDQ